MEDVDQSRQVAGGTKGLLIVYAKAVFSRLVACCRCFFWMMMITMCRREGKKEMIYIISYLSMPTTVLS